MIKYDVIVIGAGAAGLMCAITAGSRGKKVCVIDHANKPGKKILMSGGGRCNFTNLNVTPENYISHNPHFCKSALRRYLPSDFISLVRKHGVGFHEKTKGQLFCDNKSKDILNLLLAECNDANVYIRLNTTITSIIKTNSGDFLLKTSSGHFQAKSVVVATGGLSIPTMGATGFGYEIAKQFGINVYPTRAGLVPFTLQLADKERYGQLSGISTDCHVSVAKNHFNESLLFTHRGLSGPAMLQVSSYWQPGQNLEINCLPDHDLLALLKEGKQNNPKQTVKRFLSQKFAKAMIEVWVPQNLAEKKLADLSFQSCKTIANLFHHWCVKPNGTEGYRTAEVTLGGVDCDAISSQTFEVKTVPGLYFIGEVLDVTGWLGGYNFQWAWASGVAAGKAL